MENKIKASIFCATCCADDVEKVLRHSEQRHHQPHLNLSAWLKTELPEIKERCASIFSAKFGKTRRNSVEFHYDPLSYALNFEDDDSRIDEYPLRDFSARLPQSPPQGGKKKGVYVVVSREIAAWS